MEQTYNGGDNDLSDILYQKVNPQLYQLNPVELLAKGLT